MKKAAISLFCIFITIATSCAQSPETPVNESGISFTCPAGWKVTDNEKINDDSYCLSVEKSGSSSSGIVTFSWTFDEDVTPEYLLEAMQESLQEHGFTDLTYQDVVETKYGKYDVQMSSYSMDVMSFPHQGRIITFSDDGRTICIIEQEAIEDVKKNAKGFKVIEESFSFE